MGYWLSQIAINIQVLCRKMYNWNWSFNFTGFHDTTDFFIPNPFHQLEGTSDQVSVVMKEV